MRQLLMAVSIYKPSYKKLTHIIFDLPAADRASLLALFITMEVALHWLWCLMVWIRQDELSGYVDIHSLYPLWLGITLSGLFFWWMIGRLSGIKNDDNALNRWQIGLILPYTLYIATVIVMMGYSSLYAGVSLVGGSMLGMMLMKRLYVWRVFLLQVVLILLAIATPYFGINLPNLRQLTITYPVFDAYSYLTYNEVMAIENAIAASIFKNDALGWNSVNEVQLSSAFFWRLTHIYLALPKAIFIVYAFRTLLVVLDNSKNEILQHANQDELTLLNNRRHGLKQMQQTLMQCSEKDYSVVLLDLDFFKNINDSYGHEVGDQTLREVAHIFSTTVPDRAIISRYGGEEFLMALPDTSHDEALAIAEQLRVNIAQHIIRVTKDIDLMVTVSLGLYTLTHNKLRLIKEECANRNIPAARRKLGKSKLSFLRSAEHSQSKAALALAKVKLPADLCQHLISTADKALYKAKDRGRNQVVSANNLQAEGLLEPPVAESIYGT